MHTSWDCGCAEMWASRVLQPMTAAQRSECLRPPLLFNTFIFINRIDVVSQVTVGICLVKERAGGKGCLKKFGGEQVIGSYLYLRSRIQGITGWVEMCMKQRN